MNLPRTFIGLFAIFAIKLSAADQPALDEHLEPLRPWIEKTWRGEFKGSSPEKPTVDIARWERALNGKAVRILHSINDGAYGGESIITWDDAKQQLAYYYFTTAGFMTQGTVTFKQRTILTHEVVAGRANGITEVRAQTEMRGDGIFHVKTEYLKDGVWTFGRETTYHEDPTAKVILK